ncbi:hypothetical protein MJL76_24295, partial [Salmonella enterica subsp. enterica serovar Montevideo]|nr:hypothetical protein [Salmonella enterica subsp. enterica serovar Montevideo]
FRGEDMLICSKREISYYMSATTR